MNDERPVPAQIIDETICPYCGLPEPQVYSTRPLGDPRFTRKRYHRCQRCDHTFTSYVRRSPRRPEQNFLE